MPNGKKGAKPSKKSGKVIVLSAPKGSRHNSKPNRQRGATTVGSLFGPTGSLVGAAVDGIINHVTGRGSYQVTNNTLTAAGAELSGQAPHFSNKGDSIRVRHTEFIADVTSATSTLALNAYYINPGNNLIFPWLSKLSQAFTEYEFMGLLFTFKSTSGDAVSSTNNALGTVILATEYNVSNPLATSKVMLENMEFSTSGKPSENMIHPIECAPKENVLARSYITQVTTPASLPANVDPRLYYLGTTQVGRIGMQQASVTIGELWVSYDVELSRPTMLTSFEMGRDIRDTYYNTHTIFELNKNAFIKNPSDSQFGPSINTIMGIYPLCYESALTPSESYPSILFPGKYDGLETFSDVGALKAMPPAYPEGIYQATWTTIFRCSTGSSVPIDTVPLNIQYVSGAGNVSINPNIDDGTQYQVAGSTSQTSYTMSNFANSATVDMWHGCCEFSFYPQSTTNKSSSLYFQPTMKLYSDPSGTWSHTLDLRITYLGTSNRSTSYFHAMTDDPKGESFKTIDRSKVLSGETSKIIVDELDDEPLQIPKLVRSNGTYWNSGSSSSSSSSSSSAARRT